MSDIPEVKDMVFKYCVLSDCWGPYKKNKGGFMVSWGIDNFGFGTTTFCIQNDGTLTCDNECCSREFVDRVLTELAKRATFKDGPNEDVIEEKDHGKSFEF